MIKISIALSAMTFVVCAFPTSAFASERISASAWATQWATDVKNKKNPKYSTVELEKKALATCSDCENKESLKKGRELFAQGQFEKAIAHYDKIPRANTYWLSAVEEKGWAHFRQGNFEKTLAQTKTLLAPQFASISNSEAFLLQSLTQLKMCDYKGVFETHEVFKEKQKKRVLEIQNLAKTGWNDALTQVLKKADRFPMTLSDLGEAAGQLPLLAYKDIEFQRQILRFKASEKAINSLDSSYARVKGALEKVNGESLSALKARVKVLAQDETQDNFKVIQKLNLVEVEAIQRVHTDLALTDELYQKSDFKDVADNKLVFMDDGRPWIDELDKFEVSSKACVQGLRRKM